MEDKQSLVKTIIQDLIEDNYEEVQQKLSQLETAIGVDETLEKSYITNIPFPLNPSALTGSIHFIGIFDDPEDLDRLTPNTGDCAYLKIERITVVYDGSSWVEIY